ncbi:Uncharacterised protein [Klebsiella pneumoniae]|uniref:Uncharacterized protein n=1 Tax=Klebsiella pneumoniae TaxID=573 RepID=A0A377XHI0_KLEPN|nr:Uncharacterised protein [Klebsiella pneumoniae]
MRISARIKPSTRPKKHPANAQLQRKDGPFQQKRAESMTSWILSCMLSFLY